MKKLFSSALIFASLSMTASVVEAAVSAARYQQIIQTIQAACAGDGSGCAAALAAAQEEVAASPAGGTTDAQLGGIVGTVANAMGSNSMSTSVLQAVAAQVEQVAASISDAGVSDAASVVADAISTGQDISDDIVAEVGSPS